MLPNYKTLQLCVGISLELLVDTCVIALELINSDPKVKVDTSKTPVPVPTPTLPQKPIDRQSDEFDWIHIL